MTWEKRRIEENLADEYLRAKYPEAEKVYLSQYKKLYNYKPLLQKDYGLAGDCTLTALTTIVCGYTSKEPQEVYNVVEKYAKQYGYNGKGTNPLFIKHIFSKVLKDFGIAGKIKTGYLKTFGYSFADIKSLINYNIPIVLNIHKDGRQFYDNHSITIIGYLIYKVDEEDIPMLLVYDNWVNRPSVVDYKALSIISSINYKE